MSAIYDFECECDNFEMMEDQDAFSMNEGIPGPGVPAGGSAGQILQKRSQEDYDTEWVTPDGYVPAGGSAGQILKKSSAADYDTEWDSLDAGDVSFDSSLTYAAGSVGKEICDVKNTLNHKADIIYDTASGSIASFPDGADGLPVKDLTVGIEPVQDTSGGDPSPTHICPISGWTGANVTRTGVNVWDEEWVKGTVDWNTRKITPDAQGARICSKNFIQVISGETYYINYQHSGNAVFGYADKTSNGIDISVPDATKLCTIPSGIRFIKFAASISDYGSDTYQNDISVNYPSTDIAYHAYSCETLPISWQSEAGTVYAASLDALAGSLKVRPYYASYNGETLVGPWVSSMDAYTPGGTPTTGAQVVDLGGSETLYSLDSIALNTLLGQNNIWADCGPSTVEYPADTKLYIQKINTPTDDDMIADANIASGKYFIINNNLYLSTTAILAGDPIKPGTNCTATNLAAALNALNS